MAPLPENNTDRFLLDYEVGGVGHTLQMRVATGTTAAEASDAYASFLTQIGAQMLASSVTGMRFQEHGSNITIPATYSGAVTSWGSGSGGDFYKPWFVGFAGRGADGRKTKINLFGYKNPTEAGDYRIPVSVAEDLQNTYDNLVAAEGVWLTIGGTQPHWHQYVNLGANAYWQRKARKS